MSITHAEVAVGRKVRDVEGKTAGRLEEIHADWRGGECIVTHYVLAARGSFFMRALGRKKSHDTIVVPWDKLDLSDPTRLLLLCRVEEL